MKNKYMRVAFSFLIAAIMIMVSIPVYASDINVQLDKTSLTVSVGQSQTLKAILTPVNATNKKVTWSSSNTSVATVSSGGAVKGVKQGTATITVTTVDGGKTASCAVNVVFIPVTGIFMDKDMSVVSIDVGKSKTLKTIITPSDASNKKVTWTSSDNSVATVSANGSVKGIKAGTATITVKTEDGGKTATCIVNVGYTPVTGIVLDKNTLSVSVGKTATIKAIVLPTNATNQKVKWSSSDTAIATVSASGSVKGIKAGTTTIKAETEDGGKTATCTVTVGYIPVSSITLDKESAAVSVNNEITLKATVYPEIATNKNVIWTSSNTSVATVTSKGVVQGKGSGTAVITATTEDGGKSASCIVTVTYVHVTDLKMDKEGTTFILGIGNTVKINGYISPLDASNRYVEYKLSNPSIVSVTTTKFKEGDTFNIKGVREGTTTFTVTTLDGGFSKTCTIKVMYIPVTGVSFAQENTTITLETDKSITLKALIEPTDASNKKVKWTSSDPAVATVSDTGVVKGIKSGTATITVKTEDGGKTKSCVVNVVYIPVTGVTVGK